MERKEAIEVVKSNWPSSGFTMLREALETLIPELAESEDEKIRKEIISYIKSSSAVTNQDWIAWLEKQGEQKMPAMIQWKGDNLKEVIDFTGVKWFHYSLEELEKYLKKYKNIFKIYNTDGSQLEVPVGAWIVKTPDGYKIASRYVFRQNANEWSKDDERLRKTTISFLKDFADKGYENAVECIDWLEKQDGQKSVDWNQSDSSKSDFIKNK